MLVEKKLVEKDDSLKVLRVHRRGLGARLKYSRFTPRLYCYLNIILRIYFDIFLNFHYLILTL